MPRKKRKQSRIELRIQAVKRPKRMKPTTFYAALLRAMDSGEMPRGIDVQLHWRNPETISGRSREWQSDEFMTALEDSSEGFSTLVRRAIQRQLWRVSNA